MPKAGNYRSIILSIMLLLDFSYAQFSPGKLSKYHTFLEGTSNCTQCHELRQKELGDGCVVCHYALQKRINRNEGYHVDKKDNCGQCHSDHNGRAFELIYWPRDIADFNHDETGYSLTGKHRDLKCNQCHTQNYIVGESIRKWAQEFTDFPTLDRTFLGLARDCRSCHEDIHKGSVASDCQSCHNTVDWKQARTSYDHNKARYILTGAHLATACEKCHSSTVVADRSVMQLTGLEYNNCIPCHVDVHKNEVSNDCRSCHNTMDWKKASDEFDHERARFVLTGAHKTISCEKCHITMPEQTEKLWQLTGMAYDKCFRCHNDPHKNSYGNTCTTCHTTVDWKKDLLPFDHNRTKYPLLGRHQKLECAGCHTPQLGGELPAYSRCTACHSDQHDKQFIRRKDGGDCSACHTVNGFRPTTFSLAMHQEIRFALTGAHLAIPCLACHNKYDLSDGEQTTRFIWKSAVGCDLCHRDIHRQQFVRTYSNDCGSCHTTTNFQVLIFDHGKSAFPLDGKHRNVPCLKCHITKNDGDGAYIRYQPVAHRCVDCHTLTEEIR